MRKLKKLGEPQILIDNAKKWTDEYCHGLFSGLDLSKEVKGRYNNREIKERLLEETHNKCAYCESKITHVAFGDIEHILPKNKDARPDLYVNWQNLTVACEKCNRSGKGDYYNPNLPLVNPYEDDPEDYFQETESCVWPKLGNKRACITVKTLQLNRTELVERRRESVEKIYLLLEGWYKERDPNIKKVLEQELHNEYAEDKEYSSTIKAFLKFYKFPVR